MHSPRRADPVFDEASLALLACPVCHGTLYLQPPADAQAAPDAQPEGTVHCGSCQRRYPVRDGLPVLIAAAAT